jgi:hypothetical protein
MLKQYISSLETMTGDAIIPYIDALVDRVGAFSVTDKIGFALENIASSKDRIGEAIKELQAIKKSLDQQEDIIKVEVSKWLTLNGIDRIEGDRISSITVFEKAPSQEVIVDDEQLIDVSYCKLSVDKTKVKQAINGGIEVSGAHLETVHNENSIRINRKKVKETDVLGF